MCECVCEVDDVAVVKRRVDLFVTNESPTLYIYSQLCNSRWSQPSKQHFFLSLPRTFDDHLIATLGLLMPTRARRGVTNAEKRKSAVKRRGDRHSDQEGDKR